MSPEEKIRLLKYNGKSLKLPIPFHYSQPDHFPLHAGLAFGKLENIGVSLFEHVAVLLKYSSAGQVVAEVGADDVMRVHERDEEDFRKCAEDGGHDTAAVEF